jgi:hypothetical protein
MSKKDSNKDSKLNKKLRNSFLVFLISGILALIIILNKGVLFGFRLISIDNVSSSTDLHTLQMITTSNYLKKDGDKSELMISIDGEDRIDGFEIESSDEDVVKVEFDEDESKYYAVSSNCGTAVITATSTDYDVEYQVTIDVIEPITKLTLNTEYSSIEVGQETTMSYTCRPQTSDVKVNISYESSDESVATVEGTIVTGVSKGTATITGTDEITGISATFKITVK